MERGSTKHGPVHDDELKHELTGRLDPAARPDREWLDPEPPADDDPDPANRVERDEQ